MSRCRASHVPGGTYICTPHVLPRTLPNKLSAFKHVKGQCFGKKVKKKCASENCVVCVPIIVWFEEEKFIHWLIGLKRKMECKQVFPLAVCIPLSPWTLPGRFVQSVHKAMHLLESKKCICLSWSKKVHPSSARGISKGNILFFHPEKIPTYWKRNLLTQQL